MKIEVNKTKEGFLLSNETESMTILNGQIWGMLVDILIESKSDFMLTSIPEQCKRIREELLVRGEN